MASYINHPLLKKDAIESRLYQQILAGDVLKKGNTMVVAPTALGQTIVAILVAADRLNKVKNSKVLVLAPSKPSSMRKVSRNSSHCPAPQSQVLSKLMKGLKDGKSQESYQQHLKPSNPIC